MPKALISAMTLASGEGAHLDRLRAAGFDLVFPARPVQLLEPELNDLLPGVQAVVAGSEPYTPAIFAAHPALRVIARVGVGYDAVDVKAATEHGVVVTTAPGTNQDSVAEHTFCLLLAIVKHLIPQHAGVAAGNWPRGINLPLRGQTLGIAGLGRIGKAVALRAEVFGMKILAYDPFPDNAFAAKHNITFVPLERLLAESDFVSLHLPFTPDSRHLINRNTLALMKPTAFLVNTARGAIVNEADLLEALRAKRLAGAGLDVFEKEPPGHNPLFAMENVVLTPHAAGVDVRSLFDMTMSACEGIVLLSRGEWPAEKIVNPEVRARFRW
jgi:D-3-phosphoglycerate dehydrogenase / 2-oxoglutarate reductase